MINPTPNDVQRVPDGERPMAGDGTTRTEAPGRDAADREGMKRDPGQAPADPARRPGQPGAQREQASEAQDLPEGDVEPGRYEERQIPLNRIRDEPAPDPDEPAPDPRALSDGSVRPGQV